MYLSRERVPQKVPVEPCQPCDLLGECFGSTLCLSKGTVTQPVFTYELRKMSRHYPTLPFYTLSPYPENTYIKGILKINTASGLGEGWCPRGVFRRAAPSNGVARERIGESSACRGFLHDSDLLTHFFYKGLEFWSNRFGHLCSHMQLLRVRSTKCQDFSTCVKAAADCHDSGGEGSVGFIRDAQLDVGLPRIMSCEKEQPFKCKLLQMLDVISAETVKRYGKNMKWYLNV